jgi:putative ABC transport system substrate-binding protein
VTTRRDFIKALGSAATWPLAAAAQSPKTRRIGLLRAGSNPNILEGIEALRSGLRDYGYVPGGNLLIEERVADGPYEELVRLATELVAADVALIACIGSPATEAAKKVTARVPLVMIDVGDPVGAGLIKSFARPTENVTGTANQLADLVGKHMNILATLMPKLGRAGLLINPDNPNHRHPISETVRAQAASLGVTLIPTGARNLAELRTAFASMVRQGARAVIVRSDAMLNSNAREIVALAGQNKLPLVAARPHFVTEGGLVSYAPTSSDVYRRGAYYIDRILKGAKPGDLPVEQPTKFELHLNARTAKALGLVLPQSLLVSANKVIE